MRYGPTDKFYVVVDPGPDSTEEDILFQASLKDLELQFKGGLKIEENPTLFTDEKEAKVEAYGRLVAMRASEAIARSQVNFQDVARIEILDGQGKVLFEQDFRVEGR
jgi:hypothetical protein